MKKAFITGITGQDGSYLAEFLLDRGYDIHGFIRRSSHDVFGRLGNIKDSIHVYHGNLRDPEAVKRAIEKADPDEVYNLAAMSHVGISFECPEETFAVNYEGAGNVIKAAHAHNPNIRVYQASTSEMFGSTPPAQSETSPMNPVSPYGMAKKKAHDDFVVNFRQDTGFYVCSGILFNHESPRRGEHFVTRKISISFAKIALGLRDTITLGNLDAKRDWGYAGDYVEMMWLMLQQKTPDDYVIGTGISHSVRECAETAAHTIGMKLTWEGEGLSEVGRDQNGVIRVMIDEKFYRPREVHFLLADTKKAREKLEWTPKTSYEELMNMMIESDKQLLQERNFIST